VYGLCWGGKVAIMAGAHDEAFAAVAQIHPARLAIEDFEALKVPVATFLSQDEPRELVSVSQSGA
jgi:dienelactone hydrolase